MKKYNILHIPSGRFYFPTFEIRNKQELKDCINNVTYIEIREDTSGFSTLITNWKTALLVSKEEFEIVEE